MPAHDSAPTADVARADLDALNGSSLGMTVALLPLAGCQQPPDERLRVRIES